MHVEAIEYFVANRFNVEERRVYNERIIYICIANVSQWKPETAVTKDAGVDHYINVKMF